MKTIAKNILIIFSVILLMGLYLYGSHQQSKIINININRTDQSAYLQFSKKIYTSNHTYFGDRNQMPVYPFLLSAFYNENLTDKEFFERGKLVNMILSLIILICLCFIFKRYFNLFQAMNLLLITAFTLFMFKAAYFQCELLYYFLTFLSFLAMLKMFVQPSWKLGILGGFIFGITYLTKASVLPAIILFFFFALLKIIYIIYVRILGKDKSDYYQNKNKIFPQILNIAFIFLTFIITIYPYIRENKIIYKKYFYNVNSTFYMWYDSWDEAKAGTRHYGDRIGWPIMPPEDIPSLRKYLNNHSAKEIYIRITTGLKEIIKNSYDSYGYLKYFNIYLIFSFFLAFTVKKIKHNKRILLIHFFPFLFCLSYFILYFLLYAWYDPISHGRRFILSLFLPLMFSLSLVIKFYSKKIFIPFRNYNINILTIFNFIILFIFIFDIPFIKNKILSMYSGH